MQNEARATVRPRPDVRALKRVVLLRFDRLCKVDTISPTAWSKARMGTPIEHLQDSGIAHGAGQNRDVQRVQRSRLQCPSDTDATCQSHEADDPELPVPADGSVDPSRFKTTSAGFGAVTGAQPLRTIQAQLRFTF